MMKTAMIAKPGSVSYGTLRPEDLIPKFLAVLEAFDPVRARQIRRRKRLLLQMLEEQMEGYWDDDYWQEEAPWVVQELIEELNEYAPPGHYFGAHPDDGADFGWWAEGD